MKKRFHFEGTDPVAGGDVFRECGGPNRFILRGMKHGKPMQPSEDLVTVRKCRGSNHYEVETILEGSGHGGPAQVTTDEYRSGWDETFGPRPN